MEKKNLAEILVGQKMEPRYMEYNWRDIALYALAVGAKREDLQYVYDAYRAGAANWWTAAVSGGLTLVLALVQR